MATIKDNERLHKVIANAGYCSRRKAEILITNGHVKINDQIVTNLGTKVNNDDIIKIDNVELQFDRMVYLVFYKPINCLTTLSDPKNRPTVMKYFTNINQRIYPVGRLDFDTTGLLLMTNDGNFTNYILHPKHKINKVYQVTCQGILSDFQIKLLINGVRIEDNFVTSLAQVGVLNVNKKLKQTIINLTIYEGHQNQVKKMLLAVGSKVLALKRIAIGNITLAGLNPGKYRTLTKQEIDQLVTLSEHG